MKTASISTGLVLATVVSEAILLPCEAFEVNPPEVILHTLLARLILESPSRVATRQKKGMAFLADNAVENVWSDSSAEELNSQSQDQPNESVSAGEKSTEASSS